MIVITAPTGTIGHQVVDTVLAAGRPVRIIAREPATLPAHVRDRAEIVHGSHGDPQVIGPALDGADALFWLAPGDPGAASVADRYVGFTRPAADELRNHPAIRVVDISALGRGTPYAATAGYVTASLAMDDLIAGTGVAFRALACAGFMDNLLRQRQAITQQGIFVDMITPDLALPAVATRDIAAVAGRLLLDDTWTGQDSVPLLGPEHLSCNDMAATLSEVLATPVRYQQASAQAVADRLASRGMSEAMVQGMVEMAIAKDNGLDNGIARTARHAADTPTTFRQWCQDTFKPAVRAA